MASPPRTFDRELIATHLRQRPHGIDDFVTGLALDDLGDRLLAVTRSFKRALIMAPDAAPLPHAGRSGEGDILFERAATIAGGAELVDPEALVLRHPPYDLIVSIFDLQVVNDVPGFLARIRAQLAPDGLFLAAVIGGDSLTELRRAFLAADAEVSGGAFARVAPFIPLSDCGGLLQRAGFALPVTDVETHVVRHQSPLALMRELKALGASNPLADRPSRLATPRLLAAASAAYSQLAGDPDGRVRATLEIIWLSGWAPHDSQQRPLRPGTAKTSLAKVLGKKAGET
ncbi:MAG: methyltransferase domain-containing protein [Devosia sp.]|nr:methyltransferase domain-containing protein [Devosia sp.]